MKSPGSQGLTRKSSPFGWKPALLFALVFAVIFTVGIVLPSLQSHPVRPTPERRARLRNPNGSRLMTFWADGRLGNRMFMCAALLALSRFHGYTAVLRNESDLTSTFDLPDIQRNRSLRLHKDAFPEICPFGVYCSHYLNLSHDRDWILAGYFQSWRYFRNDSELIRRNFRFNGNIRASVSTTLASLNFSGKVKVGVHVRRGDILIARKQEHGYAVASVDYLCRAMDYFRSKFSSAVFLVVSDDLEWCEANIPDRHDTFMVRGSAGHDLAVLAGCDHSIITSGTFGWWGAWLAGGQTVFFKKYPLPGSRLATEFNRRDYYPPDWIPML